MTKCHACDYYNQQTNKSGFSNAAFSFDTLNISYLHRQYPPIQFTTPVYNRHMYMTEQVSQ